MVSLSPAEPPQSEFLSKVELRDLTGAARANAQAEWLARQGVSYRRDGLRIIVSRVHVREWLAGKHTLQVGGTINWAGVRGSDEWKAARRKNNSSPLADVDWNKVR